MLIKARPQVKYEIIEEMICRDNNMLNIQLLCDIAGVSRSGFYDWRNNKPAREEQEENDRGDVEFILWAFNYRGYKKGARSIYMRLLRIEVRMNIKKIRRLMAKYNVVCPIRAANPYRRMAKAMATNHVAPNIVAREFKRHGKRRVLLTDITYIKRINGEFTFLSVIIDAYTKQVLAWVCSPSLKVDFVLETVNILIENHGSEIDDKTIIHSDQGSHYTSHKFIDIVNNANLRQSMSRRGNCWDNAPQESFFGHMKEDVNFDGKTHDEIIAIVDDWMDYYNNDRFQWGLAKLSPNEYWKYVTAGEYPAVLSLQGFRPQSRSIADNITDNTASEDYPPPLEPFCGGFAAEV